MVRTPDGKAEGGVDLSRRNLLKLGGAGAGIAALAGASEGVTAQEDDGTETPTETEGDGGGDDGASVHTVRTLITAPATNAERPADFFYQPTGLAVRPGDVVKFVFQTPDHNVVSYHPQFGMRRRVPTGVDAISAPVHGWTDDSIGDDQIDPPAPMGAGGGDETGEATESEDDGQGGGDGGGSGETGDGGAGGGTVGPPEPSTWLHAFEEPGVYDLLCSPHEHFGMAMRVVVGDETEAPFETSSPEALPEPRVGPVGLARVVLTDDALQPATILDRGQVPWQSLAANQASETETETATETETES